MSDSRMEANFETECPRCLDWILPGQVIVQDDELSWVHALCPCDLLKLRKPQLSDEERLAASTETVITFTQEGTIAK